MSFLEESLSYGPAKVSALVCERLLFALVGRLLTNEETSSGALISFLITSVLLYSLATMWRV